MDEIYIPNARNSVIGLFGRNSHGWFRAKCVCCNDECPLTDSDKIYGDLYVASGPRNRAEPEDCCDICGVAFIALSEQCQAEHDAQQLRFARQPIHVAIEYGIQTAIRCRVY